MAASARPATTAEMSDGFNCKSSCGCSWGTRLRVAVIVTLLECAGPYRVRCPIADSGLHQNLESAPGHALAVEGRRLGVHHVPHRNLRVTSLQLFASICVSDDS